MESIDTTIHRYSNRHQNRSTTGPTARPPSTRQNHPTTTSTETNIDPTKESVENTIDRPHDRLRPSSIAPNQHRSTN
eukprot:911231-Rhodomonas_salina.1